MRQRNNIIKYYKINPSPIIDTTIVDYNKVLSTNSYQKGAWFLHMLRRKIGDQIFWDGIKKYYSYYKFSNALTFDFQRIMENESGQDLSDFFHQWLYRAGHPQLTISTVQEGRKTRLEIIQNQTDNYMFPLEIRYIDTKGKTKFKTIAIADKKTSTSLKTKGCGQRDCDRP